MGNRLCDNILYASPSEKAVLPRADRGYIAEEIESTGGSEKRELIYHPAVLRTHLITWPFQPAFRRNNWQLTIKEQRNRVDDHLWDNPSLKSQLDQSMWTGYRSVANEAAIETGFARGTFPSECPCTFEP